MEVEECDGIYCAISIIMCRLDTSIVLHHVYYATSDTNFIPMEEWPIFTNLQSVLVIQGNYAFNNVNSHLKNDSPSKKSRYEAYTIEATSYDKVQKNKKCDNP